MTDLDGRKQYMVDASIDHQLLSVSISNVDFLDGEAVLELARVSNESAIQFE